MANFERIIHCDFEKEKPCSVETKINWDNQENIWLAIVNEN